MVPSWLRWRRSGVQGIVEGHFWSLTRYRIGRRFVGLDYADNVIFFPAYRKRTWGGWAAVTLGAANTGYFTSDTSAVNVLEDGYPLHWRASSKLQAFLAEEKKVWQAKKEQQLVQRTAAKVIASDAGAATAATSSAASGGNGGDAAGNGDGGNGGSSNAEQEAHKYENEHNFRDALTIKCTSPGFAQRHLRLSRLTTLVYKAMYFYLWGVAISIILQAYLLFRGWLNPPARQGLKNIEAHVLHIPKLIFAFGVTGVAWVVRKVQPIVEPLLQVLEKKFPHVNWSAASPEVIASRVHQLAGNDESAQQAAAMAEARSAAAAAQKKLQKAPGDEHRVWWMRALMMLLCLFSLLCVL
ncbi:hypothetical protein DQ04_08591030 [Trypanosoma grayi]|uniref:hypothetical protein n=1 Tax=Trypanosoma grayi TaxID=71804 RepID=UPI0004F40791|nr:hypothetical protein DQ04_08591030 [Trypanosoma grayi]KEG07873.1 hypothetical protein DQ04_08591030 [Trypanosoma grayi]